jgi:inorganic pyrophosphatase
MSLNHVPAGKDLPEDIYVIIEIPANADPIKYEVDKESGSLFVDRFMSTAMFYPCNYGYINNTWMVIRLTYWCQRPIHWCRVPSFAAVRLAC